jgi:hypothetical protein
MVATTT